MSSGSFEDVIDKVCFHIIYLEYMYEKDQIIYNGWYVIKPTKKHNLINILVIYIYIDR